MPELAKQKTSSARPKRKNYHRGNVRKDLIRLARQVLETEGPAAITLRRLTREIGVNPTNFYNHFPNMDYLMAAIKVQGHKELLRRLKKAADKGQSKRETFHNMCEEYVFFAIRHPHLYRLMFDDLHDFELHKELKKESDKTLAFVIKVLYGTDEFDMTEPLRFYSAYPLAITTWSLMHGLAHILIERQVKIKLRSREQVISLINSSLADLINGISDQLKD